MSVTIEIHENIKKTKCGVYMIGFSNGFYYIGSSSWLPQRIKSHICTIRGDFRLKSTPKSLRPMAGFDGIVTFSLLEEISSERKRFGLTRDIITRESDYKQVYYSDEYLLNIIQRMA